MLNSNTNFTFDEYFLLITKFQKKKIECIDHRKICDEKED